MSLVWLLHVVSRIISSGPGARMIVHVCTPAGLKFHVTAVPWHAIRSAALANCVLRLALTDLARSGIAQTWPETLMASSPV